jgi:hypothetical protein
MIREQVSEAGANYFVGQFAFGDLETDLAKSSIELFAKHVAPTLNDK